MADVISTCVDSWHFHGTFLGRIARHRQRRREGLVVSLSSFQSSVKFVVVKTLVNTTRPTDNP